MHYPTRSAQLICVAATVKLQCGVLSKQSPHSCCLMYGNMRHFFRVPGSACSAWLGHHAVLLLGCSVWTFSLKRQQLTWGCLMPPSAQITAAHT